MENRNQTALFPAKWWEPGSNEKILCTLCPRYCTIGEGQNGFCYVRKNIGGQLYSLAYSRPTGFAIDPIEKKPLNHFLPGSSILSFGTAGCNLGCKFCQNWTTTKSKIDDINSVFASPEDVVSIAKKHKTPSIAFTYNDPVIFGEFVIDVSKLAREENIRSVMVTAGYVDKNARKDIFKYIDAANVDLKAFSEMFYHKLTLSHLNDVLDTLIWLKNETGVWVEITTLLIPGENESEEEIKEMCDWILKNLGDSVPLHFTAFHPSFRMNSTPATPASTLKRARIIALEAGIKYCYTGNIVDVQGQSTFCPGCKREVIVRDWHSVKKNNLSGDKCSFCNTEISGVFE
ncbi:MAG: AmmeMemoRadiSam system radical SAM enzyme [Ignavibacteriaceae bacterium]